MSDGTFFDSALTTLERSDAFLSGKVLSVQRDIYISAPGRELSQPTQLFVPWGNTDKWNLHLSVISFGWDEGITLGDNALMKVTAQAEVLGNNSGWSIRGLHFFRYANGDVYIQPTQITVSALMVAK